jgi:hypothetical protein
MRQLTWKKWTTNPKGILALQSVLTKWAGTPYMPGQIVCQVGCDCVRFIAGILDELHGIDTFKNLPYRLSPSTSLHDRNEAIKSSRILISRYECTKLSGDEVQPGDVVVVRNGVGPGHVFIVGPTPNTLWHCINEAGACMTGFGWMNDQCHILRVWRLDRRESWGCQHS